jgi:hypothetical protein
MSAFGGEADITATVRNFNLLLPQKLRQLGNIGRNPPRLVRQASYKFFQFAAVPLASMICTANPTSTTVTGIPMVKASCPGNIARNNASNIPAAH